MRKYLLAFPIVIGALCNYLAIRFNGGVMPASTLYMDVKSIFGGGYELSAVTASTKLKWLCDIIHLPHTRYLVSLGDCFLAVGGLILIIALVHSVFKNTHIALKYVARFAVVAMMLATAILPFTQPVAAYSVPVITDDGISYLDSTSATLLGYINDDGGSSCFVFLLLDGAQNNVDNNGLTGIIEQCNLTGLTPGTTYSYTWGIINPNIAGVGSASGSFTTPSGGGGGGATTYPSVYGYSASGISNVGSTLNGSIAADGGGACAIEFAWGTTSQTVYASYTNHTGFSGSYTTGQFYSATLSSLSPNTTYYFRTEAGNSYGYSSPSAEFSFTTSATGTTSITIGSASSITTTTATLNGVISSEASLLQVRWAYGTASQTATNFTSYTNVGSFAGSFNVGAITNAITGLTSNTTYYYRFQVKDTSNNITTSGESSFTAGGFATVANMGASSITGTTATLNGSLSSDGGYPGGVSIEFGYGTTSYASGSYASYTSHVALAGAYSTGNALNKAITSLTASTTYYFMIRATNTAGVSYSSIGTFSTQGLPIIASSAASNVALTTSRLNSALTSDGGNPCTITFGYGTVSHTAVAFASYTTKTAVAGTFATGSAPYLDISGLSAGTYYFRVQAVNSVGTVVSTSEQSFTTAGSVLAPTNIIGVPTNVSIKLTWTLGTGSSGTVIMMSTTAYPTTVGSSPIYSGTSGSFNVTNLTAGTTYYFSAWGYSGATYSATYTMKLVTTQAAGIPGSSSTTSSSAVQIPNVVRWIGSPNYQTLENVPLLYPAVNGAADSLQMPREIAWSVLAFLTALIVGIAVYFKSHSALGGVIAGGFVMGLWYVFQIMPLFYIFLYIVVGALLIRGGKEMDG